MIFRTGGRPAAAEPGDDRRILVVDDSRTFAGALRLYLERDTGREVVACGSLEALKASLAETPAAFAVAVVDLNLPDAPYGEALDVTIEAGIPTLVFTGSFDVKTRDRILTRDVVDYVLKDNELAIDTVVASVKRTLGNGRIKILVVDDSTTTRMLLARLLRIQCYDVVEAKSGLEALAALRADPGIHLVLTDYNMPEMDGFALTRQIRRQHKSDRLRVIGISSSGDRMVSAAFLKAGADDFISRPFIPEELHCRVANNADTLRQIGQLRDIASTDFLTSLHNRRYFFDNAPRLVADQAAKQGRSSVAILDIDHFKRLNDTYGHETGDVALKAVAHCLSTAVHGTDQLLARVGGEEFAIVFPSADVATATRLANAIRADVAGLEVFAGEEALSLTVSIGVAGVGRDATFDHYLNIADRQLYAAKEGGRNRVCSDVAEPAT